MPLLNKRSDTPGNRANLVPGEIGHNRADDKLLIRSDGRKIEVDLDKLRRLAPAVDGDQGAPLTQGASGVTWDDDLTPSGVVDGKVLVDAPPASWGIPGMHPEEAGSAELDADDVRIEPFYIASDVIIVSHIAVKITGGAGGAVRLGIFDDVDSMWFDGLIDMTTADLLSLPVGITLARGHYKAILWTDSAIEVAAITGFKVNQGFAVNPEGEPIFTRHVLGSADFTNGLIIGGLPTTNETTEAPGVDSTVLLRWTLPA